ncbi:DoxX family membrane protein [Dokdonia sp.]|uniref:DoxX family protein n=1 Tax=Dokdonia sp. TaxID=2024995 RepID=UPI003265BA74
MDSSQNKKGSIFKKLWYRFIFLYIILYIYPYGFEYIQELTTSDISFWNGITIWFGETFIGWDLNEDYLLNGFDSKYDYSRFLLIATLSVIGTIIWHFIDVKFKISYPSKLKVLLHTILRYHVGLTLIIYGLSKVFMLQFGEMDLNRLETSMGDQVGMSFLWTFMSYSKLYTMTSGWIEVIGGVLLLFRRSTFIGAFILFIAMANVVLIDIGYDVRVKMFAIHLFFMTLLLMSDHFKRIFNFFILNKTASSHVEFPLFTGKKAKRVGYTLKGTLLLYFLISNIMNFSDRIHSQTDNRYPSLTRFHEIETFMINGDTIPVSSQDLAWKSLSINGASYIPETLMITKESGYGNNFSFEADTLAKTIMFHPMRGDTNDIYTFTYKERSNGVFIFEGTHAQDTIWMKTKSKTLKDYQLTRQRFKWVTDGE